MPGVDVTSFLEDLGSEGPAEDPLLPPVESVTRGLGQLGDLPAEQGGPRAGVDGRRRDGEGLADAVRPELFFKALGWRVVGHGDSVRVREDSHWNVPEPELVLVVNSGMEIVGYTAGNDVSSREREGENTLYLPQAKVYDGACLLWGQV